MSPYDYEDEGESGYRGTLELNLDVIYDTSQVENERHTFIGHQLIPDLFLDRTTEAEELIQKQRRELLDLANMQSFQSEYALGNYINVEEIISSLFYERSTESILVVRSTESNSPDIFPTWLGVVFTIIVIGFSVVIGVGLGRKYASKFRGKD